MSRLGNFMLKSNSLELSLLPCFPLPTTSLSSSPLPLPSFLSSPLPLSPLSSYDEGKDLGDGMMSGIDSKLTFLDCLRRPSFFKSTTSSDKPGLRISLSIYSTMASVYSRLSLWASACEEGCMTHSRYWRKWILAMEGLASMPLVGSSSASNSSPNRVFFSEVLPIQYTVYHKLAGYMNPLLPSYYKWNPYLASTNGMAFFVLYSEVSSCQGVENSCNVILYLGLWLSVLYNIDVLC